MTSSSRRDLLRRQIPCRLARLLLPSDEAPSVEAPSDEARDEAAFAAFDAEWRALGPEMVTQAASAAGLVAGDGCGDTSRDALVKALWQHLRTALDVR